MKIDNDGNRISDEQEVRRILHKCKVCSQLVSLDIKAVSPCPNCGSIYNTLTLPLVKLVKEVIPDVQGEP